MAIPGFVEPIRSTRPMGDTIQIEEKPMIPALGAAIDTVIDAHDPGETFAVMIARINEILSARYDDAQAKATDAARKLNSFQSKVGGFFSERR